MKPLTAKRRWYCEEFVKDRCQTKAAIRAKYSEKSAGSTAHKLMQLPEIQAYIAELEADIARRNEVSVDASIRNLQESRLLAHDNKQISAAVAAESAIAKIAGHWVDRHADETEGARPEKVIAGVPPQFPLVKQAVIDLFAGNLEQLERQLQHGTPILSVVGGEDGAA